MILKSIRCSGFRGICEPLEIAVPDGFLILTGRNGAGKSSICDALEFALTGSLRRQADENERSERIEDYVWWRGSAETPDRYVQVAFSSSSGDFVVSRTPQGLEAPESQEEIIKALCSSDTAPTDPIGRMLRTAIIRDEEITQFSIDLSERERFRFVRGAIGETELPAYIGLLEKAHDAIVRIHKQRLQEYEASRRSVNELLERIAESQSTLTRSEDLAEAEAGMRGVLGLHDPSDAILPIARKRIVELRSSADQLSQLRNELQRLSERSQVAESDLYVVRQAELEEEARAQTKRLEDCASKLRATEAALQAATKGQAELSSWAQVLESGAQHGLRDGRCPLCGSELRGEDFEEHISESRQTIARQNDRLARLAAERLALQEEYKAIERDLQSVRAQIEAHSSERVRLREERESILSRLQGLGVREESATETSLQVMSDERRDTARRLERWAMLLETSSEVDDIETLKDRLELARTIQAKHEASVFAASHARDRAKAAFDAVRRIEHEMIDERLAALGPLLEDLYLRLRPHVDWSTVRYRLRGSVQHHLSLEIGDELNPRFMFSSGQRRALGIAFLLAAYLSAAWSRMRTIVLDDPVQHVDDFRALHLAEVLNGVRKQGRQVICSAEDPELAGLIARRLRGIHGQAGALVELEYEPGKGVRVARYEVLNPIHHRVLQSA